MRKIDGMTGLDMDSRDVYKPKGINNCSIDSMYSEDFSGQKKDNTLVTSTSVRILIILIVVLVGIVITAISLMT